MASPEVDLQGARAKIRDVGIVVVLTIFTLGIYVYVWYYKINRELRDFGRATGNQELAQTRPVLSIFAVTLGALVIVPAIVSYWKTTSRIRKAQRQLNEDLTNGWLIFVLYLGGIILVLPGIGIPAYVQSGLNKVWGHFPRVAEGGESVTLPPPTPAAVPPPAAPADDLSKLPPPESS